MAIKKLPPPKRKKISETKPSLIEPYDERPRISISEKDLPEVKDWSVGKEYMLEIKVKMTGSRIQDYGDNKGKISADFTVVGIGKEEKE